jgi:hypothetical protein
MAKDNRVTYRRRHSYNTRSNRIRKVKTPGGKLAVQYLTKSAKGVACGDCGNALQGVRLIFVLLRVETLWMLWRNASVLCNKSCFRRRVVRLACALSLTATLCVPPVYCRSLVRGPTR